MGSDEVPNAVCSEQREFCFFAHPLEQVFYLPALAGITCAGIWIGKNIDFTAGNPTKNGYA